VTFVATAPRARALIALAVGGPLLLGAVVAPASAATKYRYWSYWIGSDTTSSSPTWGYAAEGAGTRVPADGDVEGWRFGLASQMSDIYPAALPDFAAICAEVEQAADSKRVAIVIDPGEPSQAPDGESPGSLVSTCVVSEPSATSLQILQSVAPVRIDAGFVCGIDGYPARECAPLVDEVEERADVGNAIADESSGSAETVPESTTASGNFELSGQSGPSEPSESGTPLITAAAISILALVGFWLWRRSRRVRQS